ncbi:hypothetical protein ABTM31_21150, partial [Acinetobacter baumannii]
GLAATDGADSYQAALAVQKLGTLYAFENRWNDAMALQQQAYDALSRITNPTIAKARTGEIMSLALIESGRNEEALSWAR